MAVRTDIYGKGDIVQYDGCVLNVWERNGYHDSDFYATCWDEETGSVVEVEYDTTRCGSFGSAEIDITIENLRKVYRYYYRIGRSLFDGRTKIKEAKAVRKGDQVVVVKGRKIPKGTVGTVFWTGTRYNPYRGTQENRAGIEVGEDRMFIPLEYIEAIEWEKRIVTGKERKRRLVNFALNSLPCMYREGFLKGEYR